MYKPFNSIVWLKNISTYTTSYSVSNLSSFTTYNVRCKVEAYTMNVTDNYMLTNITTNQSGKFFVQASCFKKMFVFKKLLFNFWQL